MKLEFHPEAEEALDAGVRTATALLLKYPEIGHSIAAELRKVILHRFPYYLIYSVSSETVYIVAVAHEKRRPGYWKARVAP